MVRTNPLHIVPAESLSEKTLAIHPNDGDDLDLYTRENAFTISAGKSLDDFTEGKEGSVLGEGELQLLNECEYGTLMVSPMLHKLLSFPDNAILVREDNKLFFTLQ